MMKREKAIWCLLNIAIVCGSFVLISHPVLSEISVGEIVASLNLENVSVFDADHDSFLPGQDLNMLFVDSEWFRDLNDSSSISYLREIVAESVPVIFVGEAVNAYDIIVSPVREMSNQTIPVSGIYFDGYKYNVFSVNGTSLDDLVNDAFDWANEQLEYESQQHEELVIMGTPAAYWDNIHTSTLNYEWSPYGKLNIVIDYYKLKYDQSEEYDWYSIVSRVQSVPGKVCYGSDWRTADIWNSMDMDYFNDPNLLVDYGPGETVGVSTVTYTIGVTSGEKGAQVSSSISESYAVPDVFVHDQSQFDLQLAKWWHDVSEDKNVGMDTYTIDPGVTVRTGDPHKGEWSYFTWQVQYKEPDAFWGWLYPHSHMCPEIAKYSICWWNYRPDTPSTPTGPATGYKRTSYDFSTSCADPEGEDVVYEFDWGDGQTTVTGQYASGATAIQAHSWASSGTYSVKVRSMDIQTRYSIDYSTIFSVSIANRIPNIPSTPSGTTTCYVYTPYSYLTASTDPDADNVCYEFTWGDGSNWLTDWFASGASASASHNWSRPGMSTIYARAKDVENALSDWSLGLPISVSQNDANSCGDAGNVRSTALSIPQGTHYGTLYASNPTDTDDWFKFYVDAIGKDIFINLYSPAGADFNMELRNPSGNLKQSSSLPAGSVDWIEFVADSVGYWYLHVNRVVSEGQYRFSVDVNWPYGCPILYFYDGQQYRSEGTLNIHNPDGNDTTTDHALRATPQNIFGTYRFQLVEHPLTNSSIDQVKLYAILEGGAKIELPLVWACHSECGNVLPQLLFSDNWKTENVGARFNNGVSQSIQLWFIALPPSVRVQSFIFQIEGNNPNSKQ